MGVSNCSNKLPGYLEDELLRRMSAYLDTTPMEIFSGPGLLFDLEVYDGVQNDAAIAAVKSRFDSV